MSLFSSSQIQIPEIKQPSKSEAKADFESVDTNTVLELQQLESSFEFGKTYPFFTEGAFSIHQLVGMLIRTIGPCEVFIASWTVTEEPLRSLQNLKKKGLITHLSGLFDNRIRERNPRGYQFALGLFDRINFAKSHAKVYLLKSEARTISIVTSANWSKNPRLEAGVILTDPASYAIYHKLLQAKIETEPVR